MYYTILHTHMLYYTIHRTPGGRPLPRLCGGPAEAAHGPREQVPCTSLSLSLSIYLSIAIYIYIYIYMCIYIYI